SFPYKSDRWYTYQRYYFIDFDFDPALVEYWASLPKEAKVEPILANLLLSANPKVWQGTSAVLAKQTSTGGQSVGRVSLGELPAAWVRRLSAAECLPDTRGVLRRPHELLRRTLETE